MQDCLWRAAQVVGVCSMPSLPFRSCGASACGQPLVAPSNWRIESLPGNHRIGFND